jgi:hypothetical protein
MCSGRPWTSRIPGAQGPISLDGYAPGCGPRGDQFERNVRTGIGEQPCALADDDGIGEQVELVDQLVASSHRTRTPLRSSSGTPNPCITPSTETLVVVVNLMSW